MISKEVTPSNARDFVFLSVKTLDRGILAPTQPLGVRYFDDKNSALMGGSVFVLASWWYGENRVKRNPVAQEKKGT